MSSCISSGHWGDLFLTRQLVMRGCVRLSTQTIPPETLRHAVEENAKIVRPLDDSYFDFLATRYSYLRQFAPAFLDAFAFQSNVTQDPLLAAMGNVLDLLIERGKPVIVTDGE